MPTYKKNPGEVVELAAEVLTKHSTHRPLLDAKVKIDFLFAYPKYNEKDEPIGDAIKHHGIKALGLAGKIGLKDRIKGNGDAEILIDYEWWKEANEAQRAALLDHELHHLSVAMTKSAIIKTDDAGRPVIRLRPHDVQIGWFALIAQRNGQNSIERTQASAIMQSNGQYFWPEMFNHYKQQTISQQS